MKLIISLATICLFCGITFAHQPEVAKQEKDVTWTCPDCGETVSYPFSHKCPAK